MKKRGQGLSTNAIVLIVLAVVVLVVLIVGFTAGWDKLAPWISSDNVQTIATQCAVACNTQSVYDYCSVKRDLKAEDEVLKDVTCNYLSKKQGSYGIDECSALPCDDIILSDESTEANAGGVCVSGKKVQYLNSDKVLQTITCT